MSEDKSGWGLSSLKSLFVEEVPDAPPPKEALPEAAPIPSATASTLPAPAPVPSTPAPVPSGVVDPQIKERLEAGMQANSAGYRDLLDNLNTLAAAIPDERTRVTTAIALASKDGFTQESLLGAMDECVGFLESQGYAFEQEIKRQISKKVGSRQEALQNIEAEMAGIQEQMKAMQERLTQLSEDRGTETAAIASETVKIQNTHEVFKTTYEVVMASVQDLRNKITMYGKAS